MHDEHGKITGAVSPDIARKLAKGTLVRARKVDPVKEVPQGYVSMREFKRALRAKKRVRPPRIAEVIDLDDRRTEGWSTSCVECLECGDQHFAVHPADADTSRMECAKCHAQNSRIVSRVMRDETATWEEPVLSEVPPPTDDDDLVAVSAKSVREPTESDD